MSDTDDDTKAEEAETDGDEEGGDERSRVASWLATRVASMK
jgi:hypothetical protein